MELTKHGHSCVRVDDGDRTLVIDPGVFSDVEAALDGADAVFVTHEHPDHLDADRIRAAARADPRLRIHAVAPVAAGLADLGEQVTAVGAGETFTTAGFEVQTFGGQHALIHPTIPVVANVGVLVDGAVYHPGDSFVVPPAPVSALLFPSVAPWSKMSEVIDFVVAVRAPFAYALHDGIVNDAYRNILRNNCAPIFERFAVAFEGFDGPVSVST
jgi:glyoxylase-like metal-dependent hydrolase (beta-lactamase superfamily II)